MAGTVVICNCGTKVRLPESSGKQFRCPRCKGDLSPNSASDGLSVGTADVAVANSICPICQSTIDDSEPVLKCSACKQIHHRECWAEVGGCATYGCSKAPAVNEDEKEVEGPARSAWGDTKNCPACGETIKSISLRCRYCGTDFDTVDPLTLKDLRRRKRKSGEQKTFQTGLVALFVASLLGLFAPIVLPTALIWLLPNKKKLHECEPFYVVLGYASIVVSAIYLCIGLVLILV